jgi:hypothetical protein
MYHCLVKNRARKRKRTAPTTIPAITAGFSPELLLLVVVVPELDELEPFPLSEAPREGLGPAVEDPTLPKLLIGMVDTMLTESAAFMALDTNVVVEENDVVVDEYVVVESVNDSGGGEGIGGGGGGIHRAAFLPTTGRSTD